MSERRAYERLGAEGSVSIKTEGPAAEAKKGYLENMCFGGFQVSVREAIAPHSGLDFEMDIATAGDSLRGKGVVRHCSEKVIYNNKIFLVGVEFSGVNRDEVVYLLKRIQARSCRQKGINTQGAAGDLPF